MSPNLPGGHGPMRDTRDVPMRALFYGGPADGGELVVLEPVRRWLRFPMTTVEVSERFGANPGHGPLIPGHVPATYQLDMTDGRPWRDTAGRIRYLYVVKKPAPTPTERNDQ